MVAIATITVTDGIIQIPAIETIVVIDERVQRENLETRENRIPPIQGLLSVTM